MKNGFYRDLAELAQEANDELNKYEQPNGESNLVFDYIRRVAAPCLDGDKVKESILADLPLREHMQFRKVVLSMARLDSLSKSSENTAVRSWIDYIKHWGAKLSNRTKRSHTPKIFYSWQATLPSNSNRNFIRTSLSRAIDELNEKLAIDGRDETMLDSDTANVPGSPDIIKIILSKIDESTILVADITLVNETQPNANVMFELGYAVKSLGESNIILLFNEHYGSPRDLPFDLVLKRAMLYRCDPESENKSVARKELATKLKGAIDLILDKPAAGID